MKKKFLSIISVLFLCTVLFAAVSPLCCFATVAPEEPREFVRWRLSEDERTLNDGKTTYTRYDLPLGVFIDSKREYVYENTVFMDGDDMLLVSNVPGGPVVWCGYGNTVFVADKAREALDEFTKNDKGILRLSVQESGKEATLSEQTLSALNALTENTGKTVMVQELEFALVYTLYLYDESDVFCKEYGGIYSLGGKLYYLNYRTLDNNRFDADGMFSYRSGNVTLYPLDSATKKAVNEAKNDARYRECETVWENDTWSDMMMEGDFPVAYAFWGFVLPAAFLVLGIVLPMRKRGKHWRILIPLSGVWMLLATALLIVIL